MNRWSQNSTEYAFKPSDRGDTNLLQIHNLKFYHPVTGSNFGQTTFLRQNLATLVFETAGHIHWLSNLNATVHFGIDEVIDA